MKKIIFLSTFALFVLGACKKQTTNTGDQKAALTITYNNSCDGKPVEYGKLQYTNAAGNLYSITMLKYYISNVVLVHEDNTEHKLQNYDLMDAFDLANFSTIEAKDVPYGKYTKMKFYVGIDKVRNHSGAQDGDLDPIHQMIWTWATGYIFSKHEGTFVNNIGDTVVMQYHMGTNNALADIEIPINLTVDKATKKMSILFDLNKMYNSPVIDFNTKAIRHSTSSDDIPWIADMVANAADAFVFQSQD